MRIDTLYFFRSTAACGLQRTGAPVAAGGRERLSSNDCKL
jgi:hypothetical protein